MMLTSVTNFLCGVLRILLAVLAVFGMGVAYAQSGGVTGININGATALPGILGTGTADAVKIAVLLTVLSLAPALVISMTAFIRTVIVLSILRHAIGMPETPPTTVLISLALFITIFVMSPVLDKVNTTALQPFLNNRLNITQAADLGSRPLKEFMLAQVKEEDVALMYRIAKKELPTTATDVSLVQLIPAFMLNELRVAFQIGFVIFIPFLLIDLVISSVLLALGMLMVPPATIALPLKVLMFVLIDGWALVLRGVAGSFTF